VDFVRSKEARQLVDVQQAEQMEKQVLAQRRQADHESLERQKVTGQVERERDRLQLAVQRSEVERYLRTTSGR
jgi:hypothetical protein